MKLALDRGPFTHSTGELCAPLCVTSRERPQVVLHVLRVVLSVVAHSSALSSVLHYLRAPLRLPSGSLRTHLPRPSKFCTQTACGCCEYANAVREYPLKPGMMMRSEARALAGGKLECGVGSRSLGFRCMLYVTSGALHAQYPPLDIHLTQRKVGRQRDAVCYRRVHMLRVVLLR